MTFIPFLNNSLNIEYPGTPRGGEVTFGLFAGEMQSIKSLAVPGTGVLRERAMPWHVSSFRKPSGPSWRKTMKPLYAIAFSAAVLISWSAVAETTVSTTSRNCRSSAYGPSTCTTTTTTSNGSEPANQKQISAAEDRLYLEAEGSAHPQMGRVLQANRFCRRHGHHAVALCPRRLRPRPQWRGWSRCADAIIGARSAKRYSLRPNSQPLRA